MIKRRITAFILVLALMLSAFAVTAFADGDEKGLQLVFDGEYYSGKTRTGHDYYRIPIGKIFEPWIYDLDDNLIDSNEVEVTYYNRNDDAETLEDMYAENEALEGLPEEIGSYFGVARGKDGKELGTGYVDFDIYHPEGDPISTACFINRAAKDGETLYLPDGGEMYVEFELSYYDELLIPGWRNDLLAAEGFEIDDEPYVGDDGTAYAHIKQGSKKIGDTGTLYYNWYRIGDIFGPEAVGWVDAEPVYSASVVIEVAEQPKDFAFVYGRENKLYFEGDTIKMHNSDEIFLANDLTYYTDWYLCERDFSDAADKGFTVYDTRHQIEQGGYIYNHLAAYDIDPGTKATVYFKWYPYEEFLAGTEGKEPAMTGSVDIEVIDDLQGDSDGDGEISILDATAIQRKLAGLSTESYYQKCADSDRDGEITILDATAIQRNLAGMPGHEDIGEEVTYGTYFAMWNIEEELLPEDCGLEGAEAERAREEIRKALNLLVDRAAVLDVIDVERIAASTFVSKWVSDADGNEFFKNAGDSEEYYGYYDVAEAAYDSNVAEAVEILKKYYTYDGESGKFTNVPELRYIYNDSPVHGAIANVIADCFSKVGIVMKTESKNWNNYLEILDAKGFSLARDGWIADYDDPLNFLEMYTTDCEDNFVGLGLGSYADAKIYSLDLTPYGIDVKVENGTWAETYDVLIEEILDCEDKVTAYEMMHLAEDMLMATGCIMPLYYY